MPITFARSLLPSMMNGASGTRDNLIRMLDVLEAENLPLREKVADLALATALLRDELDTSRRRAHAVRPAPRDLRKAPEDRGGDSPHSNFHGDPSGGS